MGLFDTKTPEQKEERRALREAQRAAEQVRRDAEAAERARQQAEWDRQEAERKRVEKEMRKARFDAFPEFVVREYREVTVKARNEHEAKLIAEVAFKKGQDDNDSVRRHLRYDLEGNTIDRIRRVAVKVAQFLD